MIEEVFLVTETPKKRGEHMELLNRLFHRREHHLYDPVVAKCFSDFLFDRDPQALLRSRTWLPYYFLSFSLFVEYSVRTKKLEEILVGLKEQAEEGWIAREAFDGVHMTVTAVLCGIGCVIDSEPTFEDWREYDRRLKELCAGASPDEQQGYVDFANRLMSSIHAIASSPNAVIDQPVLRAAIIGAVLFAWEAEELGIGCDSGWLDDDGTRNDSAPRSTKQTAEAVYTMLWSVTHPLGALLTGEATL